LITPRKDYASRRDQGITFPSQLKINPAHRSIKKEKLAWAGVYLGWVRRKKGRPALHKR